MTVQLVTQGLSSHPLRRGPEYPNALIQAVLGNITVTLLWLPFYEAISWATSGVVGPLRPRPPVRSEFSAKRGAAEMVKAQLQGAGCMWGFREQCS